MNQQTRTKRPNRLLIFLSVLVSLIIIDACRKIDKELEKPKQANDPVVMADKFFTIPFGTHPTVKALAENMQKQNVKLKFTETLIKNAGYPRWDKAKVQTSKKGLQTEGEEEPEDTTIIYVPFTLANSTSGIMTVAINLFSDRDSAYNMLYPQQYKQYGFDTTLPRQSWNSRNLFTLFFEFNKEIFNTDSMYVFDGRIFGKEEDDTLIVKRQTGGWGGSGDRIGNGIATEYWENSCIEVVYCVQPPKRGFRMATNNIMTETVTCSQTTLCNSVWVEEGSGSGSSGGGWNAGDPNPFAYPSGGGGGGTSAGLQELSNIPQCPVAARQSESQHALIINPCDPPWVPAEPSNAFNPYMYDTVGITSALENGYPCIAEAIENLRNLNFIAQLAGQDVFGDSAYTHITFDTSTVNTQYGQATGGTTPDTTIRIDENGKTHFFLNIKLNGWYLRNATHEYNLSTIVHEAMHAIFVLRWGQYQVWLSSGLGTVDSNYLKDHFGIYWTYLAEQQPTEAEQHILMGTAYINKYLEVMRPLYNTSAPAAVRDTILKHMIYSSLRETSMWKLLPGLGVDTCKVLQNDRTASDRLVGTFNMPPCGIFTTHYADSLHLSPACN